MEAIKPGHTAHTQRGALVVFTRSEYSTMVIRVVVISKLAQKQLSKVPGHVALKLAAWVELVEHDGLAEVRKVPGFHDEPLHGQRKGQRSIRLNNAYRAIYEIRDDGRIDFISVEEVSKHDY